MTISVVQSAGVKAALGATSATITINTTTGNLVHADFNEYTPNATGAGLFSSFSDSAGNTWLTAIASHGAAAGSTPFVQALSKYAKNATGQNSNTYTYTCNGGATSLPIFGVIEISGLDTSSPLDVAQSNTVSGTASPSLTTSSSTAQASEIAIGGFGTETIAVTLSAESTGWTTAWNLSSANTSGANPTNSANFNIATKILSSTGTVTYNPTAASSTNWEIWIVTYKAAAGGGTFNPGWAHRATRMIGGGFFQ
jgi:hypothetical protein